MFTPSYIRQWIRDLRPHCTSEEISAFLWMSMDEIMEHARTVDEFNDVLVAKRKAHHCSAKERAARRRAWIETLLPMGFRLCEIAKATHSTKYAIIRDLRATGKDLGDREVVFKRAYRHARTPMKRAIDDEARWDYERKCEEEARRIYGQ